MSDKVYQSKNPKYAGHTAGPWRPSEDGKYVEQDREIQYTIASTWHDASVDNRDELEANAALIADAPYLACEVERLRELCGELQSRIKDLEADLGIFDECHDDIYDDRQGNANTRDYQ